MPDMQKLQNNKEKILSVIQAHGPSFPARVARETSISPLFTSAFLSELVSERKLKLSNMRVGSSPLYFIEGQEAQLENFTEYLNSKEKEAFHLLKNSQVLEDEKLEPAIRVALRKIKDFASPINVRIDNEIKIFWRFFSFPESESRNKIELLISPKTGKEKQKKEVKEKSGEQEIKPFKKAEIKPLIKPKKPQTSEFGDQIKEYL